jgi:hypothetical protein
MKLTSQEDTDLKFEITGYRFLEPTKSVKSNSLNLKIEIGNSNNLLVGKELSLEIPELDNLTRWFMKILLNNLSNGETWSPLNNAFKFEFIKNTGSSQIFRFYCILIKNSGQNIEFLEFKVIDKELSKQIQHLLKYQRSFPARF